MASFDGSVYLGILFGDVSVRVSLSWQGKYEYGGVETVYFRPHLDL